MGKIRGVFFFLFKRADHHMDPKPRQKSKNYPVVKGLYHICKCFFDLLSGYRHKRLKTAEIHPHLKDMSRGNFFYGHPFTYRHRQGIHGQGYRHKDDFYNVHAYSPVLYKSDDYNTINLFVQIKSTGFPDAFAS